MRRWVLWLAALAALPSAGMKIRRDIKDPVFSFTLSEPEQCRFSPNPHQVLGAQYYLVECSPDIDAVSLHFEKNSKSFPVYADGDTNYPLDDLDLSVPAAASGSKGSFASSFVQICDPNAPDDGSTPPCQRIQIDVTRYSDSNPRLALNGVVISHAAEQAPKFKPLETTYRAKVFSGEPVTLFLTAAPGFFVDVVPFDPEAESHFTNNEYTHTLTPTAKPGEIESVNVTVVNKSHTASLTYTIQLECVKSTDPRLATVTVSPGRLDPQFEAHNYAYYYRVPEGTRTVSVSAKAVNSRDTRCFAMPLGLAAEPANDTRRSWTEKIAFWGTSDNKAHPVGASAEPIPLGGDGSLSLKVPESATSSSLIIDCIAADETYKARYVVTVVQQFGGSTELTQLELLNAPFDRPFDPYYAGPYHATLRNDKDDRWVSFRVQPQNPHADCSVDGIPVAKETHLSPFFRMRPGDKRIFHVRVQTPQNPVPEEYAVAVDRPAVGWFSDSRVVRKLGEWVGATSTVLSLPRPETFIANAKYLQLLSLSGRINSIPESHDDFTSGLHKYNLQYAPAVGVTVDDSKKSQRLYGMWGDGRGNNGSDSPQTVGKKLAASFMAAGVDISSPRGTFPDVADIISNAMVHTDANSPDPEGAMWKPAYGDRGAVAAALPAAVALTRRQLAETETQSPEDAKQTLLNNLDAELKAQEAVIAYTSSIIFTTIALIVVAVVYAIVWATYLHDSNVGFTTLRQDFPAALHPTRFWAFLFDYSLISSIQSAAGILFARKSVQNLNIRALGLFNTTPQKMVIFAAIFLLLVPVVFIIAGLACLIAAKRDLVFSNTYQAYHDGQAEELKAHKKYLSWLPIFSNLFKVEIASVAPVTRHPTTRQGISDGPVRFEEELRENAPWMAGSLEDAKKAMAQTMDVEKGGSEALLGGKPQKHQLAENTELLRVNIPEDVIEVRPDTINPAFYTRYPDALVGYSEYRVTNPYDKKLDLLLEVQLRYLPHLINIRGQQLLVPRCNLRQDQVDNFNLLFAKAPKGNVFAWAADRCLTAAAIVGFAAWNDTVGYGHILLIAAALVLLIALNVPSIINSGVSYWFSKMDASAESDERKKAAAKESDRLWKVWPFRRAIAREQFEKLREVKMQSEMFGIYTGFEQYIAGPVRTYICENEFFKTRVWSTVWEAGLRDSLLGADLGKLALFVALLAGNMQLMSNSASGILILLITVSSLLLLNAQSFKDWGEELRAFFRELKFKTRNGAISTYDFFRQPYLMPRRISHFFSSCQRVLSGERGVNFTYPGFNGETVRDLEVDELCVVNNETGVRLPGRIAQTAKLAEQKKFCDFMERRRFGMFKTVHLAGPIKTDKALYRSMPVQLPFKQFFTNGTADNGPGVVRRLAGTLQITNYDESRGASGHDHGRDDDSFLSLFVDNDLMPEFGNVRSKTAGHGYVVRYLAKKQVIEIKGPGIIVDHEYTVTSMGEKPPLAVEDDAASVDSSLTAVVVGTGARTASAPASCRASGSLVVSVNENDVPDLTKEIEVTRSGTGSAKIVIDPNEVKVEYCEYNVGITKRREMFLRSRDIRAIDPEDSERGDVYTVTWTVRPLGKPINASGRAHANGILSVPWTEPTPPDMSKFIAVCDETEGDKLQGSVIDIDPRDTDAHQFILPPAHYDGVTKLVARFWNKFTEFARTVRGRNLATEAPELTIPCTIVQCVNPLERLFRVEPNFTDARITVKSKVEELLGRKSDLDDLERLGYLWTEFMTPSEFVRFWDKLGVEIVVRGAWINPVTNANHMYIKQNASRVADGIVRFRSEISKRIDARISVYNKLQEQYKLWEKAFDDVTLYSRFLARDADEISTGKMSAPRVPLLQQAKKDYESDIPNFQFPMTVSGALISRREKFEAQLRLWREEITAWLLQIEGASMLSEQGGRSCVQAAVDGMMQALERSSRRVEHAHSGLYRSAVHYLLTSAAVRGRETNWRPDPLSAHHAMVRLFPCDQNDPNNVHFDKANWTSCFLKLAADRVIIILPHELDARAPAPEFDDLHPTKRWNWNWTQAYYIPLQCFERMFLSIDASIANEPDVPEDVRRMHAKLVMQKNTEVHVDDRYVKALYTGDFFDDVCCVNDKGQVRLLKIRLGKTVPNREAGKYPNEDKFYHGDKCTALPLTFRFHHSFFNKWQSAIRLASMNQPRKVASVFDGRVLSDDIDTNDEDESEYNNAQIGGRGQGYESSNEDESRSSSSGDDSASSSDHSDSDDDIHDATKDQPSVRPVQPAAPTNEERPVIPVAEYQGEFRDKRFSGKNGKLYDEYGNLIYEGDWTEGMRWGNGLCRFKDAKGVQWEFEGTFIADEMRRGKLRLIDENELARLRNSSDPKDRFRVTEFDGVFALPSTARTTVQKRAMNLKRSPSNCGVKTAPQIRPEFLANLFNNASPAEPLNNKHLVIDIRRALSACADPDTAAATEQWVAANYGKNKATTYSKHVPGLANNDDAASVTSDAITLDCENALDEYLPHRSKWARLLDPTLGYDALEERFIDGTVSFADGSHYRGQMQQGLPHGNGTLVCPPCKLTYSGEWKKGRPNGNGHMTVGDVDSDDRIEYFGKFVEGKRQGNGVQLAKNGKIIIKGEFAEDKLCGEANSITLADDVLGSFPDTYKRYVGGVDATGDLTGKGKLEWGDGYTYKGGFNGSNRDGVGTMKDPTNKTVVAGTWAKDFPDGRVEALVLPDGKVFTGDMRSGQRQGMGELYAKGVSKYEGLWNNDVPEGRGTLYCVDGEYEGEFVNGKRHGKGRFEFNSHPLANGKNRVYEGDWVNDQPDGVGRYLNELGVENTYKFKAGELIASSVKQYKSGVCGKAPIMGVKFKIEGNHGVTGHNPKYWGFSRRIDAPKVQQLHAIGAGVWEKHENKPFEYRDSFTVDPEYVRQCFQEADEKKLAPQKPDVARSASAETLGEGGSVEKGAEILEVRVLKAENLIEVAPKLHPYCKVKIARKMKRTKPINGGGSNPAWNANLVFARSGAEWIEFECWHKEPLTRDELIGAGEFNLREFLEGNESRRTIEVPMTTPKGDNAGVVHAQIHLTTNRFATGSDTPSAT